MSISNIIVEITALEEIKLVVEDYQETKITFFEGAQ